jgi:CheY-like chemotaxis protein
VLADLRRQFDTVAASRNLALHIADSGLWLKTDRVMFGQVLQNLLNNALKYTRAGGVRVSLTREGSNLRIDVSDSGVGIEPAALEHVFDEYFQAENSSTHRTGFGLGLTIVRYVTRLLGLTVSIASEPGVGTTASIGIPAAMLMAPVPTHQGAGSLSSPESGSPKPGILVVEDDKAVRNSLVLFLELQGYPTWVADSAESAEELFADHQSEIDVIVSDFQLSDSRNGIELLEKLREVAGRDLPAVILSGDTSPALASMPGLRRTLLLHKPVDASQLIAQIEKLFGTDV